MLDRVRSHGYNVEEHSAVTEDGYILGMFRMSKGHNSPGIRVPVLLMHSLLESSNQWTVLGENSLAYLLADAGYDVWLGNARGTQASRKHVYWSEHETFPDPLGLEMKFWQYSWHEIAIFDLPELIDLILGWTNSKKLHYVGFSQGTTALLVLTSMRPEYNSKIIQAHLLAPVAYMAHVKHALLTFLGNAQNEKKLKKHLDNLSLYKLTLENMGLVEIVKTLCQIWHNAPLEKCDIVHSQLESTQLNETSIPLIVEHAPGGISTQQLFHYGQLVLNKRFQPYDYRDDWMNTQIYGSSPPPEYDLTRITVPINLFSSHADDKTPVEDVNKLRSELRNVKLDHIVTVPHFGHTDFVYSRNARTAVYDKLISVMNDANKHY
ncbi:lipase 3-like [Contarinia nasturtii]|uniref:lipase 3-like n=1 Tax=Contarinia nasturtii TaxID=265458 RepID=UPI0012D39C8C|nr:lipase 3-like [Contarinia nasturtii]